MWRAVLRSQEQVRGQGKTVSFPMGMRYPRKVALPNSVKTILARGGGVRKSYSQRGSLKAGSRAFPLDLQGEDRKVHT